MSQKIEESLVDIQVKIAYQDDIIEGLNQQIAQLSNEMSALQKQMQYVMKSVRSMGDLQGGDAAANEPPPHY